MTKKKTIIFIDSGDTLIDEGTEVRDEQDIVVTAELIPGADQLIKTLSSEGYTMALVADGNAQSFKNMFTRLGLYDLFDTLIYSENIKASKPDRRMFQAAVGALDLKIEDYQRIIMVGNNLKRDIKGANEVGITSVFLNWTRRYSHIPADQSEEPDYIIGDLLELLDLVKQLDTKVLQEEDPSSKSSLFLNYDSSF